MNASLKTRLFSRFMILIPTLAILYFIPYTMLSDFHIIILATLIAIPIAAYRLEYRLFARRAVITMGCTPDGLGKKLFWNAALMKLGNYAFSFLISIILILVVSSFQRLDISSTQTVSDVTSSLVSSEWTIVFASTLLLIILEGLILNTTKKHTRGQMAAITQRGIIKWPVLIFITAIAYLRFFYTGHDYYVGSDLETLMDRNFHEQIEIYASPLLGLLHASNSALDTASMYYAQNYIPRIDDTATKWVIWSYLAIKSAISVGIVIYLMLGILTLASVQERGGWKLLGRTLFERYFTATLIIFIAVYIYASRVSYLPEKEVVEAPKLDCNELQAFFESANEKRDRELSEDELTLSKDVAREINENIDNIFAAADPGIEKFLDWHFSVIGEYQQLGTQILPKLQNGTASKLKETVTIRINNKLNSFGATIDSDILTYINKSPFMKGLEEINRKEMNECFPSVDFAPLTFQEVPVHVGQPQSIIAGGAVAAIIAKKTAAKLTAKTAGKLAGKYAATFTTGLTAAGLCGPFAPLCGIGAATVTWFAMDAVIVTADEFLNRDELRQDINRELDKQKENFRQEMLFLKLGGISELYDRKKWQFKIPEDGVQSDGNK